MDFSIDCHAHARVCSIFDYFRHYTLFFNVIQNFAVNFAYLSLTRTDLMTNIGVPLHESIKPKMLVMNENIQLQNINTKSKWRSVVPSCYYDNAVG